MSFLRSFLFASILALGGVGCTLTLDPGRHVGGGSDAGPRDVGVGVDAPVEMVDGSTDAMRRDAGPPECTTDAECTSLSQCVDGYCTLCLPSSPAIVDVHADPGLRDELDLVLASHGMSHEVVVGWRGTGTRMYLHRTPLDAPAAPGSVTSVTDAFLSLALLTGTTEILDLALGDGGYSEGEGRIDLAVIGRNGASESFLGAAQYSRDTTAPITSLTYPDPERLASPATWLSGISITGGLVVTRENGTTPFLRSWDLSYLNPQSTTMFDVPIAEPMRMTTFEGHAFMDDPTSRGVLYVWNYDATSVGTFATPDRTGDASITQTGATTYLVAYPADAEIHVREVNCFGTCAPSATVRTDIRTGSTAVDWVEITTALGEPLLLSGERAPGISRLLLRGLRTDLRLLTAPIEQPAYPLDGITDPGVIASARVGVDADESGVSHLVAFWLRRPMTGERTARLTSIPLGCP